MRRPRNRPPGTQRRPVAAGSPCRARQADLRRESRRPPARVACLQDSSGVFVEVGFYATPLPGNRSYSVGLSDTVGVRDDGTFIDPAAIRSLDERAREYVTRAMPGPHPEPRDFLHCWVTGLPWSEDGAAVWEADSVLFVAGHNLFKQASALGRALARAATGGGLRNLTNCMARSLLETGGFRPPLHPRMR